MTATYLSWWSEQHSICEKYVRKITGSW